MSTLGTVRHCPTGGLVIPGVSSQVTSIICLSFKHCSGSARDFLLHPWAGVCVCVCVCECEYESLSRVQLFVTHWTLAP